MAAPTHNGFSSEVLTELLRALAARAEDHPESPGLIASWPGVPAKLMPAACAELQRQGHPVHEISIVNAREKVSRGWVVDLANGDRSAPGHLTETPTLLLREVAEPATVTLARAAVAGIDGLTAAAHVALAIAVTEACANVVAHAYVGADVPGHLEVRAWKAGTDVIVEVADAGRGMVPHLDHPGLGLGLPMIAQVTDAVELRSEHRGLTVRMHFSSAPGH